MANLIRQNSKPETGEILNKWFDNRMIVRNQNVLNATTGGTGSGKSLLDLSVVNSWYLYKFNRSFPIENCCFSISELMKRLTSGELQKGELLILEEAGVNLGALDFQNRISKLFTYVLQSFRSLNVGILFNLPTMSMLNKSTRLLVHCQFVTGKIDYQKEIATFKSYFRQVNQQTGKVYNKHMRIKLNGKVVVVKKFAYPKPPKELVEQYETKKLKFVTDLSENFVKELEELDRKAIQKQARNDLTEVQQEVLNYLLEGYTLREIAEKRGIHYETARECVASIKKKGYKWKKLEKPLGNQGNQGL